MNDKTFEFSKKTNIILYGAASIGHLIFENLTYKGYNVIGFIDQRANELSSFIDRPVWALEEIPIELLNNTNTIIIISIKNVFEHEEIVKQIISKGIFNIIYKPYNILQGGGSDYERKISKIYDAILNNQFNEIYVIPQIRAIKYECKDYALIKEIDDFVLAYIPVEFIFTNNYINSPMEKWGNINILAFFTHIGFWNSLLQGNDEGFCDYVNEYCMYTALITNKIKITDMWKKNVIRNRIQIFEQMKLSLETDPLFFVRNAAAAEWNEKGYFNLTSGKHRTTFLAAYGYQYIPLKIKKSEYNKFINKEAVEKLSLYLRSENSYKLETVIPHPYFFKHAQIKENGYYIFLRALVDFISRISFKKYGKIDFSKLRVCDCIEENCNIVRLFSRMGSCVYRSYNSSALQLQIDKLFNTHLNNTDFKDDEYDIAVYNYKFFENIINDQKLVDANYYIIMQAQNDEFEKICFKMNFKIIIKISYGYEIREDGNYLIEKRHG